MPSFVINPLKTGQTPTYYHPSLPNLKENRPSYTVSETGLATPNKRVSFYIKESQAANSAVASDTVMINNSYTIRSNPANSFVATPSDLPPILQNQGICQIIPFLHMIQSQLNFPIDYQSLWSCLSEDVSLSFTPIRELITQLANSIDPPPEPIISSYRKLYNLMFNSSDICIPVGQIAKCFSDQVQNVGPESESTDCDDACLRKIRIQPVKLSPVSSEQEFCDRLNSLGPQPAIVSGLFLIKLALLDAYYIRYPDWESVKNLTIEELYAINPDLIIRGVGNHAITIVGCQDGKFIVKNSWGGPGNTIEVDWDYLSRNALFNFNYDSGLFQSIDISIKINTHLFNYYPKVTECFSLAGIEFCNNQRCIEAGYDYYDVNSSSTCKCANYETTPTTPTPTTPTPTILSAFYMDIPK